MFSYFTNNNTIIYWALTMCQSGWVIYIQYLIAAAAAAKSLQSCLTLCDPMDCSPPGSPSLGFSRQEHWSGLPFPSPMHESEKWKWSRSVMPDSSRPHGLQPTRLLRPWDFPGKSTGVGCHCLLHIKLFTGAWFIRDRFHEPHFMEGGQRRTPAQGTWPRDR